MMQNSRQLYSVFTVFIIYYKCGLHIGWNSPSIVKLMKVEETPLDHVVDESEIAIMNTLTICLLFASLSSGFLSNKIGRKKLLLFSTGLMGSACILVAVCNSTMILYIGKFLNAQGVGLFVPVASAYLGEIVSVNIRGYALSGIATFQTLGILSMYIVGPYVNYLELSLFPVAIAVIAFVMLFFVPESPVYYMKKGKEKKALQILKALNRSRLDLTLDKENETMLPEQPSMKTNKELLKELFLIKKNRRVFLIVIFVKFCQQASGVFPVIFNATRIFNEKGSSIPPHIATMILGAIQLVAVLCSNVLIELLGRRFLLLVSCGMTAIANFLFGVHLYLEHIDSPLNSYIPWLPVAITVTYIFFYSIGFGAVAMTVVVELLDTNIKQFGSSFAFFIEDLTGVLVTFTFDYLNNGLGKYTTFWLYSSACVMCFLNVYLFIPETKGKSNKEIQAMLRFLE